MIQLLKIKKNIASVLGACLQIFFLFQIKYAAEDASIAVQIFVAALFKKFSNRASAVTKSLELTVHKELWQMMIEQCHNNIDVQFLQPKKSVKSRESNLTKKSNTKPPKNLLTKKHLVR